MTQDSAAHDPPSLLPYHPPIPSPSPIIPSFLPPIPTTIPIIPTYSHHHPIISTHHPSSPPSPPPYPPFPPLPSPPSLPSLPSSYHPILSPLPSPPPSSPLSSPLYLPQNIHIQPNLLLYTLAQHYLINLFPRGSIVLLLLAGAALYSRGYLGAKGREGEGREE